MYSTFINLQVCPQHRCVSVNINSFVLAFSYLGFARMARGHQKLQSQQKNAKKQAEMKKAKGHDQKTAAKAALVFTCLVCKVSMMSQLWRPRSQDLLNSPFDHWEVSMIYVGCIVPSLSPRCLTQKPSSSTLRASTRNPLCLPSWRELRHKRSLWTSNQVLQGPVPTLHPSQSDSNGWFDITNMKQLTSFRLSQARLPLTQHFLPSSLVFFFQLDFT